MKCTNKEQETAECEKRGCKGCFYNDNKMEEKEINEAFEIFLNEFEEITDCFYNSYLPIKTADKYYKTMKKIKHYIEPIYFGEE